MRFIENEIKLSLSLEEQKQKFVQHIYSKIICNNKTEIHQLEKKIQISSKFISNNTWRVKLETEALKLKLPSVYKKQENIKEQINNCLNIIDVKVNLYGKITTINNHDDIIHKWYDIRKNLEKNYTGKAIIPYFNGVEKKILSHDLLLNDFNQYRLFGLFYNQLYKKEYTNSFSKNSTRKRTIDNMVYQIPLDIEEQFKLEDIKYENTFVELIGNLASSQKFSNEIKNLFSTHNITSNKGIQLNKYHGKYNINTKTGMPEKVTLKIETAFGSNYNKFQEYKITSINT